MLKNICCCFLYNNKNDTYLISNPTKEIYNAAKGSKKFEIYVEKESILSIWLKSLPFSYSTGAICQKGKTSSAGSAKLGDTSWARLIGHASSSRINVVS